MILPLTLNLKAYFVIFLDHVLLQENNNSFLLH